MRSAAGPEPDAKENVKTDRSPVSLELGLICSLAQLNKEA